ncbi:hypothetical protein KIH74_26260 [Kineosporia sp. J2-2]|uniref:DUF4179 domain-containing protein n=1 Tax=Kineosporia corallincola TaxID=2835133 RepID=A0ABS5TN05_9ACTN|nr:hypothetical protein [Kineosporia corallincola]MBT0772477.1 hypothetical protein [Kineosporia corallincola]
MDQQGVGRQESGEGSEHRSQTPGAGPYVNPGPTWGSGNPPQTWGAPPPASPQDRKKQRLAIAGIAGALGLALVAAIAVVALGVGQGRSDEEKAADLAAPFLDAANSLKSAPGLTYEDDNFSVRLTRFGDFTGTLHALSQDYPVLRADGVTYGELDGLMVGSLTSNWRMPSSDKAWVELKPAALEDTLYIDTQVPDSPADVAQRLVDELNKPGTDFQPSVYDSASTYGTPDGSAEWTEVTLDGTAAYKAQTDAGPVFVSRSSPHTVLQIPVALLNGDTSATGSSSSPGSTSSPGSAQDNVSFTRPKASAGPEVYTYDGVALTEMTADQVSEAYDDLLDESEKLKEVLDVDVTLSTSDSTVKCKLNSCKYSIEVTVSPVSTGDNEITDSTTRVGLTASFEVDHKDDVASCTSAATFKMRQTKTLSCSTTKTASTMKKAYAAAKSLAQSQAGAGEYYRWEVPYNGYGEVKGIAQLDLKKMGSTLEDRRSQIGR